MSLTRRQLLGRAAGVAGGVLFADVLGLQRPASAAGPQGAAATGDQDPNFLHAQIHSIKGDTITALTPEFATRLVRVSRETEIWRTYPVSLGDLRPGDFFYARGILDDDGYLDAQSVRANIVNLTGSVSLTGNGRDGELMLPDRRILHVHMAPNVELFAENGAVSDPSRLPVVAERAAQVLGMWDERTQMIEVTGSGHEGTVRGGSLRPARVAARAHARVRSPCRLRGGRTVGGALRHA